jgi:hypothetical protein
MINVFWLETFQVEVQEKLRFINKMNLFKGRKEGQVIKHQFSLKRTNNFRCLCRDVLDPVLHCVAEWKVLL